MELRAYIARIERPELKPTTAELIAFAREELYQLGAASDDPGAEALTELERRLVKP